MTPTFHCLDGNAIGHRLKAEPKIAEHKRMPVVRVVGIRPRERRLMLQARSEP